MSEINLDTTKYHVQEQLHKKIQRYQGSKLHFTSSSLPAHNTFKPGGTMTFSNGKHTGRFIKGYTNNFGRWVAQTYLEKQYQKIHFISVYCPCRTTKGAENQGTNNSICPAITDTLCASWKIL